MNQEDLCLGCMEKKEGQLECPRCSWRHDAEAFSLLHLKPGTVLQDKYLIGRVLGQGGFGITYLAWELNLDIKIAIKEYFPQGLATRITETKEITVYSEDLKDQYGFGLERFLHEAKMLARFERHPNIVTVRDFFKANGTAYIVMNYIEGITLEEYITSKGGKLSFQKTLEIMMPVMDALGEIHASGYMHRDISPDNIFLDVEGRVILIDFGAAREDMREKSKSLSVILKAGYAPEEQYRSKGEQGPWSDVYSVGATMYKAITGELPPESLDRLDKDELLPPNKLGIYISANKEQSLMKAMSVRSADRFKNISDFQRALQSQSNTQSNRESFPVIKEPQKDIIEEKPKLTEKNTPKVNANQQILPDSNNRIEKITFWRQLPGFRTGAIWKNVIGGLFYFVSVLFIILFLSVEIDMGLFFLGFCIFIVGCTGILTNIIYKKPIKPFGLVLLIGIVIMIVIMTILISVL